MQERSIRHETAAAKFEKAAIDRYPGQRDGGHFLFDKNTAVT